LIYALAQVLIRVILRLLFRVEVEGRENVPEDGFIAVANHLSWTDTLFIMYALPPQPWLYTMANESTVFNKPWKRWLLPRVGVFPIRRNRGMLDEEAVNGVYRLLEEDKRVLIFPEGAYGKDGLLRPLKDGVGYFAINSGKPILPISLSGTNRLRPFAKVRVVIGRPFIPVPPLAWTVKKRVNAVVAGVRTSLSRLGRRSRKGRLGSWRRLGRRVSGGAGGFWRRARYRSPRAGAEPGGAGSAGGDAAQVPGVERAQAVVEGEKAKA
jgi:1-acyl-sn-glycerol-3-phosphate acyltransferase